jgi:hypothetical protein
MNVYYMCKDSNGKLRNDVINLVVNLDGVKCWRFNVWSQVQRLVKYVSYVHKSIPETENESGLGDLKRV